MCSILDDLTNEDYERSYSHDLADASEIEATCPCIFSCISPIDKNKQNNIVDIIFNNSPIDGTYKIFNKKEFKDFVLVGFSYELLDSNPACVRRFLFNLCNNLEVSSCSISIKRNDSWDIAIFLKDELSYDNWKSNSSFKEFFAEYLETIKEFGNRSFNFNIDVFNFKSIYHSGNLLMRNIDSDKEISEEEIIYIRDIIDIGLANNEDLRFPLAYDNIFRMMYYPECNPSIPILLKKDTMYYEELWKGIEGDIRDYRPKGKTLGYYMRMDEDFCEGPHIVLSPENIEETAKKACIPFRVLFTNVLVHEIAHAFMDKYRDLQNGILMYANSSDNWPLTIEAKAMEESLANMITLEWFKKHAAYEEYQLVKHFIDNWQNSIYRFGIWQESISADWMQWFNSSKQESQKLKEWFNLCFSSGNISIPISNYSSELFNNVFK